MNKSWREKKAYWLFAMSKARALGASAGIAGLALALCVVLISQAKLTRPRELVGGRGAGSILTRDGTVDLRLGMKKQHLLQYLKQDGDVAKPVHRKMHALSLTQILNQNERDVDDLRPTGPTADMTIGPDGLGDEGSLDDLALLNGMSREMTVDADEADAVDARHNVGFRHTFLRHAPHDMTADARKIDKSAQLALAKAKSRNTGFRIVGGVPIGHELDGHGVHDTFGELKKLHDGRAIKTRFHALPVMAEAKKQREQTAEAQEDWTVPTQQAAAEPQPADEASEADDEDDFAADLGEEGPAEANSDPMPPPKHAEGPGIWIEPGSNKGYDSFALDSLQVKGTA